MKAEIEKAFGALIVWQVAFLPIGYFLGWGWAYAALVVHNALGLAALYAVSQNMERARD